MVLSVVDIVAALTDSANPRDYWYRMKRREQESSGVELSTLCRQLKLVSAGISKATFGITPSQYKKLKGLKRENLRDHMNDLERSRPPATRTRAWNIPTRELRDFVAEEEAAPMTIPYPRDPSLVMTLE